jgi:hypothetical protein
MAIITSDGRTREQRLEMLRGMDHGELLAQEVSQQGAIHAVSFLLQHGCSESTALQMLSSLREFAGEIRAEHARRGTEPVYETDQTAFN